MKTPSATSLPRAPRDDTSARFRNYVILMAVRVTCFVLMVLITPYGWYTWILALGAVFLPYIAVMIANVGSGPPPKAAETPLLSISSTATPHVPATGVEVIRITEATPPQRPAASPAAPANPDAATSPATPDAPDSEAS